MSEPSSTVQSDAITIGFYGADTPTTFPNLGNRDMMGLGKALGAPMFRSLSTGSAFKYLEEQTKRLRSDQPDRKPIIRIFGHSWGAISAVQLAWKIKSRPDIADREVALLAVIDPVSIFRLPPTSVPGNVGRFWNRYQTHGRGVTIMKQPVFGRRLKCEMPMGCEDQKDLNPGPSDNLIDHWTIIEKVKAEFLELFAK